MRKNVIQSKIKSVVRQYCVIFLIMCMMKASKSKKMPHRVNFEQEWNFSAARSYSIHVKWVFHNLILILCVRGQRPLSKWLLSLKFVFCLRFFWLSFMFFFQSLFHRAVWTFFMLFLSLCRKLMRKNTTINTLVGWLCTDTNDGDNQSYIDVVMVDESNRFKFDYLLLWYF